MNNFRNFMIGRYGTDQLSVALLVLTMILTFLSSIFHISILKLIAYVPLVLCIYRVFSKNIFKRRSENTKFLSYWNPIEKYISTKYTIFKNRKVYKYFKCPNCKQMLRAPKGKGKIAITCQKCHHKFIKEI